MCLLVTRGLTRERLDARVEHLRTRRIAGRTATVHLSDLRKASVQRWADGFLHRRALVDPLTRPRTPHIGVAAP
jgi:hypothetical protein